ncbi:HAD family hydrolase [Legionella qingyii]|uniref:HAD family hydrolase n=1 Tax=Legionella qingyii TaxID=2184757 RepID=A0ABY0CF84_9GAMM|nr:HAD-IA family hydrolase [Legionella qingyii]RUR19575.1 HAD family hydrolase [Legionella qingyii]RUR21950.1 HAD family hydrolase [Legionella qingyii]
MSNPYDLVVFDWEGTIADTVGIVLHIVATEANLLGFGNFDPYQARKYVELGLVQALRKTYPHLTTTQHQQLLQAVQLAMHSRSTDVCLMPGVRELIHQMHEAKITLAIATNKGQQSLLRALQTTGLDNIFKITRSAGQVPAKPCPQMLEEIIEEHGGTAATTLMIGDSLTDMEMAKGAQVTAVGIDVYHQQEESALKAAGAVVVFDDYEQIADFLNLSKSSKPQT